MIRTTHEKIRSLDQEAVIPRIRCKPGDSITIGSNIVITVRDVSDGRAHIDLDIPRDIGVKCDGIEFENVVEIVNDWFKH